MLVTRRGATLACLLLLAAPLPAAADRGVSISLGSISVSVSFRPGQEYRLPRMFVSNPGDEASGYVMDAGPIANAEALGPDPSWFVFDPASFSLEPGARREVVVAVQLPADVQPGRYEGLIRAVLASDGSSGAVLGAAAGTRLSFTVDAGSRSVIDDLLDFLAANAPWSWLVVGSLAVIAATLALRRRFTVRVERRT